MIWFISLSRLDWLKIDWINKKYIHNQEDNEISTGKKTSHKFNYLYRKS